MNDQDYRPNEWIPIVDAKRLDDKVLTDTQRRLNDQGKETRTKRRENGKITLYVYGGYRA